MNKWLKKAAVDHYEEMASKVGKSTYTTGCAEKHYKDRVGKYGTYKRALYEIVIHPQYLPYIRGNDDVKYNDLVTQKKDVSKFVKQVVCDMLIDKDNAIKSFRRNLMADYHEQVGIVMGP